jgi:branched-chain amino acid transport system permease protein
MDTVVVSGTFVGLVYGLLAIGLVVVYRGSRVINFAYGETGMIAAFVFVEMRVGSQLTGSGDLEVAFALPLAIALGAVLGAVTEFLVVRPLRNEPRLSVMVGTFALAGMFLTFGIRRWGLDPHFTKPLLEGDGVRVAQITIQPQQFLILVVSLGILAALGALYRYTAFGLRLRATALDPYAAALSGINTNATSIATWALAGALAAVSAILIAPLVTFSVLFMTTLMIRAVAAALVGGLTSIWGAFGAGVLLGVAEAVIAFKSPISGITDAALACFILVLMIYRPAGLIRSAY